MKKLVQVQEVEGQGFEALLGQQVSVFCMNYIYHGKLTGVNDQFILLQTAHLVYETGDFQKDGLKNAELLSSEWRIQISSIESYGVFVAHLKK